MCLENISLIQYPSEAVFGRWITINGIRKVLLASWLYTRPNPAHPSHWGHRRTHFGQWVLRAGS